MRRGLGDLCAVAAAEAAVVQGLPTFAVATAGPVPALHPVAVVAAASGPANANATQRLLTLTLELANVNVVPMCLLAWPGPTTKLYELGKPNPRPANHPAQCWGGA